jgi:catechol 2,3-dioxygenase-like lactoylglutathione lyase family enzyme
MTDTVRSERFVQGAATIVPVRDVAATVAFYVDVLGFERRELSEDGKYGLVACGEVGVMVLQSGDDAALLATSRNISIYIWVDGVDAFYHALKSKLDALPQGRVRPPFDQPYGMREFHVKDPDGCLLFFGQEIDG